MKPAAWSASLKVGGRAWFVECEPSAASITVRIAVDASDSCAGDRGLIRTACQRIADRLATGDRYEVWAIGDTAPRAVRDVSGTADRQAFSGACDVALKQETPGGTWLVPTIEAMRQPATGATRETVIVVVTDGEVFDAGEIGSSGHLEGREFLLRVGRRQSTYLPVLLRRFAEVGVDKVGEAIRGSAASMQLDVTGATTVYRYSEVGVPVLLKHGEPIQSDPGQTLRVVAVAPEKPDMTVVRGGSHRLPVTTFEEMPEGRSDLRLVIQSLGGPGHPLEQVRWKQDLIAALKSGKTEVTCQQAYHAARKWRLEDRPSFYCPDCQYLVLAEGKVTRQHIMTSVRIRPDGHAEAAAGAKFGASPFLVEQQDGSVLLDLLRG